MIKVSEGISPSTITQQAKDTLKFLTHTLGLDADEESIIGALARHETAGLEPLDLLIHAGAVIGLRISPVRLSLGNALWAARDDQPLVALSAKKGFLLIRRHGFFSARISFSDNPQETVYISRKDLIRLFDKQSLEETLDIGFVTPARVSGFAHSIHDTDSSGSSHSVEIHEHPSPMRRFFSLLEPEMKDVWTILVFSVITGILYLALPLAVNALVSNLSFGGQSGPFVQALVFIALAMFACLALSAIIRGLQYYVAEVIQRRLFVRMAADLAYRLPRVHAASLEGIHAPEMVNRFLDVVTVQKSTSLILLNGINVVLGALIGLVVLGFYHPFLLAFTLVLVLLMTVVVLVLGRGAIKTSIDESISKYEVVNWLEELARYPRLFKGPGGYALAARRADDLARKYLTARRSHFRVLMRQINGLLTLEVLASSALLIVGGWLVIHQQLTLGQLVASELIVGAIVASISKLGKQFEAWYDAMAAVDKLGHLVDLQMERETGESPLLEKGGVSVTAQDVAFRYSRGDEVFAHVSFDIAAGERVALKGAQGSGCSTLLDLLLGLHQPTRGHISIAGCDLRSWRLEDLRSSVMLIRGHDIVNGSIVENVRLGRPEIGLELIVAALRSVGLLQDALALPQGLNAQLVTGGLPLSSHQRTRILLARALVMKPRLLIVDDLFDGMDPVSLEELTAVMLDPALPWTVIIATRDPDVAKRCGRHIDLNDPACHAP